MQRTLLNIKPDAVGKNLIGEIIRRVEVRGFRIVAITRLKLTPEEATAFYAVHEGKPFFPSLIEFMTEGPCVPMVVEGENVIVGIRELIGATDPAKAEAGTVRKDLAESVTRNAVHASDAEDTARQEIAFFFKGKDLI